MTAGWMVYVLIVGTLLAVAASAVARALRHLGHATRFAYAAALGGLLVLAIVAPRARPIELRAGTSVQTAAVPAADRTRAPRLRDRVLEAREAIGDAVAATTHLAERTIPATAMRIVAMLWLGVSAVLMLTIALVNRRLIVARRSWPSRLLHGTPVRVAQNVGPAVVGLTRAEVVVPHWLLALPEEKQRLVVEHEREHLRARDHLLLGGSWVAVAVVPWHPAVWYLADRIRLAIELDCDARVLRRGASARSYGTLLIDMAARQSSVRLGALALADGPSHLERRIQAMQSTSGRRALARGVLLAAVGGAMVLVACEAKVPTSAEIESMDVAGAQRSAARAGFVRTPDLETADFIVNGALVNADSARALEGRHIGSITVVKSERPQGRDTIYVVTRDRMSAEERRRSTGAPDPLERVELDAAGKVASNDSTEQLVAHVARELSASRTNGSRASAAREIPELSPMRVRQSGPQPIFLLDGRKSTMEEIASIPESRIVSVSVLKTDGSGIDPSLSNGIIAVKTRTSKKP